MNQHKLPVVRQECAASNLSAFLVAAQPQSAQPLLWRLALLRAGKVTQALACRNKHRVVQITEPRIGRHALGLLPLFAACSLKSGLRTVSLPEGLHPAMPSALPHVHRHLCHGCLDLSGAQNGSGDACVSWGKGLAGANLERNLLFLGLPRNAAYAAKSKRGFERNMSERGSGWKPLEAGIRGVSIAVKNSKRLSGDAGGQCSRSLGQVLGSGEARVTAWKRGQERRRGPFLGSVVCTDCQIEKRKRGCGVVLLRPSLRRANRHDILLAVVQEAIQPILVAHMHAIRNQAQHVTVLELPLALCQVRESLRQGKLGRAPAAASHLFAICGP